MDLSMSVESALVDCFDLMVLSIDWSTGFGKVPQASCFQLAERQGKHPRVLQPLRGMYSELRRRFVMAVHVGKEYAASNGIIQGSSLRVLSLNFLKNTWARSVQAGTTAAMPTVYAVDAGVLSKDGEDIDVAFKNTGYFARATKQKLNVEKKQSLGHHGTAICKIFRLER